MAYKFKLVNQQEGSHYLGKCEVCGKYVDTVYLLTIEKEFDFGDGFKGWSQQESTFGHKECLEKIISKKEQE